MALRWVLVAVLAIRVVDGWSATSSMLSRTRRQTAPIYTTCLHSVTRAAATTTTTSLSLTSSSSSSLDITKSRKNLRNKFQHTLAILTMPCTSTDKIANEAILNQAVQGTRKLSVVLRANGKNLSLARLRRYVGEVYSALWDVAMSHANDDEDYDDDDDDDNVDYNFCDVVVYPQNLPNTASEQWINKAPDLDSVCGHDSTCGWVAEAVGGRGMDFSSFGKNRGGIGGGGLDAHVLALNAERAQRKLPPVQAVHVHPWPMAASSDFHEEHRVAFLDDEPDDTSPTTTVAATTTSTATATTMDNLTNMNGITTKVDESEGGLLGGAPVPPGSLFEQVAVGGTFDGMHYGHRKLLTLAVSSVNPASGKLLVGVTVDEMLRNKAFSDQIPKLQERMDGAREFLYRLAPGLKNRVKLFPIADEYGPPGAPGDAKDYDALVLSHETLANGRKLNDHRRTNLGLPPLSLLCTRRTEPHGMSSTALRRRKWEQRQRKSRSRVA